MKKSFYFLLINSFSTLSVYADLSTTQNLSSYKPGNIIEENQLQGGYNQSAEFLIDKGFNVEISADYIYWKWQQETLQLGTIVEHPLGPSIGSSYSLFQNPGYKSGFQVGVGFDLRNMDYWNLYAEYTWYKNTDTTSVTSTPELALALIKSAFRGTQEKNAAAYRTGTFNFEAELGFQSLDVLLERAFYSGKKMTASFATGLKAMWITQSANWSSLNWKDIVNQVQLFSWSRFSNQTTWSLGPKIAFDANWLLGYGLKIVGNTGASLVFTSYNTNSGYKTMTNGSINSRLFPTVTDEGLDNYGTLTPILEFFLGMGWGSYFSADRFHLDILVGYDFNAFLDYSMQYYTISQIAGNMYLHGLNAKACFKF